MERVPLEVETRTPGRSSAARALRRSGKIPGILYGAGREPAAFAVATTVLREALTGEGGRHAILDVRVPGERAAIPAILKEFQLDPIRDRVTHVDLLAIRLDEPIEARTSVVLIGESRGVKFEGGVLEQPTHEISILGLPSSLVDHVEVDVSELGVGDSLKLADVAAPEGLTFTGDLDLVIATVTSSSPVDLPEDEVAEVEAVEGEEPAAAEPEAE
jgi:large subunit ribosomal protein L25